MEEEQIFEVRKFLFDGKEGILRKVQGLASYVQNPTEYTQRDLEQFSDDYLDTVEELKVWADDISVFMVTQRERVMNYYDTHSQYNENNLERGHKQ